MSQVRQTSSVNPPWTSTWCC